MSIKEDIRLIDNCVAQSEFTPFKLAWENLRKELMGIPKYTGQQLKDEIEATIIAYCLMKSNPHCSIPDGLVYHLDKLSEISKAIIWEEISNNDICRYCLAEVDDTIDCAGMDKFPSCFVGRKLSTVV